MADTDADELRLLYEVTTHDLVYFKTQQWSVTYYALLIDAGLIGITQLLKPSPTAVERIVLTVLALLTASAAAFLISKLEQSLSVRKSRLHAVRTNFGGEFKRAWSAEHKGEEVVHSVYFLYGAVAGTALLTSWLLLARL